MFDSHHVIETETRCKCSSDADREPSRLTRYRVFGILERREHPDSNLTCAHQVRNALVGRRRLLSMGRQRPREGCTTKYGDELTPFHSFIGDRPLSSTIPVRFLIGKSRFPALDHIGWQTIRQPVAIPLRVKTGRVRHGIATSLRSSR